MRGRSGAEGDPGHPRDQGQLHIPPSRTRFSGPRREQHLEVTPAGGRGALPDVAFAVALAALPDMTPARLRAVLDGRPARELYAQLLGGDRVLAERLSALWGRASTASDDPTLETEQSREPEGGSVLRGAHERTHAHALEVLRLWRRQAALTDVAQGWEQLRARGVSVVRRGDPQYPVRLLRARQVPELIYYRGRLDHACGPCVGIVGTRRATHYGLEIAAEIGRGLAERGVVVVSGLARGIDAAAHWGALAAPATSAGPLAVVGGGVDVVYPRENLRLSDEVLLSGGIISEAPLGAPPESWRFPLRNRIIAALSQVLVLVESSRQGGAMHTVLAADAYGVPVVAVPGSVRSPQSEGTNAIIQEGGAGVALDVHDVLAALALASEHDGTSWPSSSSRASGEKHRSAGRSPQARSGDPHGRAARSAYDERRLTAGAPEAPGAREPRLSGSRCTATELVVLAATDYTATLVDVICLRTKLDLGTVALAIDRLAELGLVRSEGPAWVRK
ncbi:MAG: DNA-processing protein DprA [Acidimicrobiales bacterium]